MGFDENKIFESRSIVCYQYYDLKLQHLDHGTTMLADFACLERIFDRLLNFKKDYITTSHILTSNTVSFYHPAAFTSESSFSTSLPTQLMLPLPVERPSLVYKKRAVERGVWKKNVAESLTLL